MDWSDLERIGWTRKEFISNGKKKLYYLTPEHKGLCRKIKSVNDQSEKHLALTLFPANKRALTNEDNASYLQTTSKVAKQTPPSNDVSLPG